MPLDRTGLQQTESPHFTQTILASSRNVHTNFPLQIFFPQLERKLKGPLNHTLSFFKHFKETCASKCKRHHDHQYQMRQLYVSQACCKLKKIIPCTPPGIPGSCRCHKFLVLSIGTLPQPSTVAHQNIMHSQWVQKTKKQILRFFNTAIHQYGSVVLARSSVALFAG